MNEELSLPSEIWIEIIFRPKSAEFSLNQTATKQKVSINGMTGIITNVITGTFIPLARSGDVVDIYRMTFNRQFPFHIFAAFPLFMKSYASCMFVSRILHKITIDKLKLHCEKLQNTISTCVQMLKPNKPEENQFYISAIYDQLITHMGVVDPSKICKMCIVIYDQMTSELPRNRRTKVIPEKVVKLCIGKLKNGSSCSAAAKFGEYCGRHKLK